MLPFSISLDILQFTPSLPFSMAQKKERDGGAVGKTLSTLEKHAGDETVNLMPDILECVKVEATLQEICDVLRGVFGEAQPVRI